MKCRLCGSVTRQFLDLGSAPLPEDLPDTLRQGAGTRKYPLGLSYCTTCFHIQLSAKAPPDEIYKKHYLYDYSVTETGRRHWKNLAGKLIKQQKIRKESFVVDIGSNTGVLLSEFKKYCPDVLGVDPSPLLARIAIQKGIPTRVDFFTVSVAKKIRKRHGRAHLITITNVFDHVDDLTEHVLAICELLDPDGICVIEVPYFIRMLSRRNHIVYHQQIDYMAVTPLIPFFRKFGLTVADATITDIHGGSLRLTVTRTENAKLSQRVIALLAGERSFYRNAPARLALFAKRVTAQRNRLAHVLHGYKKQGKSIAAIGASAKGLTLLAYTGIGNETIDFITDRSPLKTGRFTPSGIPVVEDSRLIEKQPDIAILLAWNFADEIVHRLGRYRGLIINPLTGKELPR